MRAPVAYSRAANPELVALLERHAERIEAPIAGCAVLFQFPRDQFPRHMGIYTGNGYVLHADGLIGRVVEHGLRMHWLRWVHSYWRIPGVAYEQP